MSNFTLAKIAVMLAVRGGACEPLSIADVTGLPVESIMAAAACLRGDGEHPELLCCLDGDPWALTLDGRRLLEMLL